MPRKKPCRRPRTPAEGERPKPTFTLRDRIVGYGKQPASQFKRNPLNWRTHPPAQRRALEALLRQVGWVLPVVVVQSASGELVLLDGHERVDQALRQGDAEVPYVVVDLNPEEERLVLASLDPIAELAGIDAAQLEALLDAIQVEDPVLSGLLGRLAQEAGLEVPLTAEDPLVEGLEAAALTGWGETQHRVILVFDTEAEAAECLALLGLIWDPRKVIYAWHAPERRSA